MVWVQRRAVLWEWVLGASSRGAIAGQVAVMGEDGRVTLAELQAAIAASYGERDAARGIPATVAWIAEEVGELAQAVRKGTREEQVHEFGDVIAWVVSLANQLDVDLTAALERYAVACPKCGTAPCSCP